MTDDTFNFYLYRITVHPSTQLDLFNFRETSDRTELLRRTIEAQPDAAANDDTRWFLTKPSVVDSNGYHLRLGRRVRVVLTAMDTAGQFHDREDSTVLNTHVFIDVQFQVSAIAFKSQLSPTVKGLGNSLATALNRSETAGKLKVEFEVAPMKEPGSFLRKIRSAYRVTNLSVTTRRPNPWDASNFYRSVAESLEDMGGREAEIKWKGEMTPNSVMEEAVSEAAALGRDATAFLRESPESKKVTRHTLADEHISLGQRIDNTIENGKKLLNVARLFYKDIRSGGKTIQEVRTVADQEKIVVKVGVSSDER
ncbi:hypothetical protein WME89_16280 [Sorangium sp. So ce321]|uniref:hypothetical protein n=1 Tax=Sorangium sp. So ce321 TaxID=3133300 RepID=UPI003F62ED16